jgi:hypothetical protein
MAPTARAAVAVEPEGLDAFFLRLVMRTSFPSAVK